MSTNLNMEKILKLKRTLEKKSLNEGLTKKEREVLNNVKKYINEAPIDYEGPERMDPGIEKN